MTRKSYWKLVPLAVFLAAGLFMFSAVGTPTTVQADIDTVLEADDDVIGDGGSTSVTFTVDPATTDEVEVRVTGVSSSSTVLVTISDCGGCDQEDDELENNDSIDVEIESGEGSVELDVDVECTSEDDFRIEITTNDDDEDSIELTCDPDESADGNIVISIDTNGDKGSFDFDISGDSSCDETFTLTDDGDEEGFNCDEDETYVVSMTAKSGWTLTDIDCDNDGGDFDEDVAGREVEIDIDLEDDLVECIFVLDFNGTATPTATATTGTPGNVTVQAVPNAVNCNGSSFITVVVRTSSGGQPVDGALVNVSTTLGSVSPGQATTSNGSILTIFTAPANNGGTATISATSSGVSGTATIQVNCSAATAVPPTAVPTQAPSQPGPIRPPSTGDAGLVSAEQGTAFGWEVVAAAAVVTAALVGAVAVRRHVQG